MKGGETTIENHSLYFKPCILVNYDTDEGIKFRNEDPYDNVAVKGRKIFKIIVESDYGDLFGFTL